MYRGKKIAVAVPAYNEGKLIGKTIEGMPKWIDRIIVVDDKSRDGTLKKAVSYKKKLGKRLVVIGHNVNQGVGGSIATGYKEAVKQKMDICVVMAGDNQMDPKELPRLLDPVVEGRADYSKGNRLLHTKVKDIMPQYRFFGNSILSILNKVATGYWHVMDPQNGYAAITAEAIQTIPLDKMYKRYGQPNDILALLNVHNFRVIDVPMKPVYKGEESGINLSSYIPKVSWLLIKRFFWRMKNKYILRDFHPLVLFYFTGMILIPAGVIYGIVLLVERFSKNVPISANAATLVALLLIMGFMFIFFGMFFDMEYNKNLHK